MTRPSAFAELLSWVFHSDEDIPQDVRAALMECARSNGVISYYYLCNVYRVGKLDGMAIITSDRRMK